MAQKFYKKLGETSFQCVGRFREEYPEYKDATLAFAGRLDPMAEGEMLILIGDDNYERDEFMSKDKIYTSEYIFGLQTDTFDLMGLIKKVSDSSVDQNEIEKNLKNRIGKQMQKFPPFSKRHVKGKAMFWWAAQGRIDEIEIPEHEIEIYSIDILKWGSITGAEIAQYAIKTISTVEGDFRQEKIISGWKDFSKKYDTNNFQTVTLTISCGTGTYIRQIAEDVGIEFGMGALTKTIKREEIT